MTLPRTLPLLVLPLLACTGLFGDDTADSADAADSADSAVPEDTGGVVGTRGVWAWRNVGDPNGTDAVVGDPVAEAAMIATLQDWGVSRVYGSYGDRPVSDQAAIASWNAQLDAAGIESHLLLGDPAWISSREWASMLEKIDDRLLTFNAAMASPADRFDGLHLDIEPQAASDWSTTTDADRYNRVTLLMDTYDTVRSHLDGTTGAAIPVYADLPVWFDNLPPSLGGTGSIAWPDAATRDAWFVDLGTPLAGITLMAYERDSDTQINSAIAGEQALFTGELRVGLNEEVGTTWATITEMFDMADTLEGQGQTVDLHSYSAVRAFFP